MGAIELDCRAPAEDLRALVTIVYRLRASGPVFDEIERADHAQVRFRLSPGALGYRLRGAPVVPAAAHLLGPTTAAFRTTGDGPVEIVGFGLRAAGWAAGLASDASGACDRAIDGEAAFGAPMGATAALIAGAEGTEAKLRAVEAFARAVLVRVPARPIPLIGCIDDWLAGAASPAIEDLVATTRLSRRQVERQCNALCGVPPKMLARRHRALRAAAALVHEGPDGGGAVSLADGFYDQSHLTRELKRFAGLTPKRMRTAPTDLARATVSARRALAGQVHATISHG